MFGKYKQTIFNILSESYSDKKSFKTSFHKTMDILKKDKTLREFFVAYGILKGKTPQLKLTNEESSTNNVYDNLDTLIFKSSVGNIDNVINAKDSLVEHMTRKVKDTSMGQSFSTSIFSHIATKKYNEKYADLSEDDRTKLKQFLSMNESEIKNYTDTLKEETLTKLNVIKGDTDKPEMKDKIQNVMEGIIKSDSDLLSIVKMENLNKSLIK